MQKTIDMEQNYLGRQFGTVTVVGKTPWFAANGDSVWKCLCACGCESYKTSSELFVLSLGSAAPPPLQPAKKRGRPNNRTRVTVSFPVNACPAGAVAAEVTPEFTC